MSNIHINHVGILGMRLTSPYKLFQLIVVANTQSARQNGTIPVSKQFTMKYKLLNTEVHKLRDGSPGHDDDAILGKLRSLEVFDVRLGAVHACQRMRDEFKDGVDSDWADEEDGN
ncbi:hypothetical protein NOF04DRAFT_1358462 [Fusarium oxysporum II5]|nr:hypothetical protein NOF04DRAFT_1358462 [Fusarium oxysporum II5]